MKKKRTPLHDTHSIHYIKNKRISDRGTRTSKTERESRTEERNKREPGREARGKKGRKQGKKRREHTEKKKKNGHTHKHQLPASCFLLLFLLLFLPLTPLASSSAHLRRGSRRGSCCRGRASSIPTARGKANFCSNLFSA